MIATIISLSPNRRQINAGAPDGGERRHFDFQREVAQMLDELGFIDAGLGGYFYPLYARGQYGVVRAWPMEGWLACRVDNPALIVGTPLEPLVNPGSGKLNFHPETPSADSLEQIRSVLEQLI